MADAGGLPALSRMLSARVWRRLGIAALTLGLLLVVGLLVLPTFGTSQETRDARDVFCLQSSERGALADAAVALQFARPGSSKDRILVGDTTLSAFQWRDQHHDDYVRACDALSAASGKTATQDSTLSTTVLPLLGIVLTWALTFVTTRWQIRTTRRQTDAGELRAAVTAYNDAANRFLDSRVSFPADLPTTEMDAARDALVGRLGGVVEREAGWTAVRDVITMLRDGELGTALDPDLRGIRDSAARGRRIDERRNQVRKVCDIGFLVADALAENGTVDRRLTRPLAEGAQP